MACGKWLHRAVWPHEWAGFDVVWRDLLARTAVGSVFFNIALFRFRKAVTQTQI